MTKTQFDDFTSAIDAAIDIALHVEVKSAAGDAFLQEVIILLEKAHQKMLAVHVGAIGLKRLRS